MRRNSWKSSKHHGQPSRGAGHCAKSFRIRSFSGPYFLTFGPEKIRIRTLFTQGVLLIFIKISVNIDELDIVACHSFESKLLIEPL